VAFYLSGQLLTEDYYVANKLMKGFVGSANVDTNSRLCMASATAAHKRAFGTDAVPGCYEDLELADLLLLVGTNMAWAHPVLYQRIVKARQARPGITVVLIDPRQTATADVADIHLALRPGSDAFLFNGLLAYLAQEGALDRSYLDAHCVGIETALAAAREQVPTLARAAAECDLDPVLLARVYGLFARTEKVVTVFSQGINQSSSGVDKGNAIINCHLATGKIGRPGACPFSITGQPNAMGGREVGGLANQLAAHMDFSQPDDIERVARFWQAPRIARHEGRKAVDMFRDVHEGRIRAIWIVATNPAATMPDAAFIREALERCELVLVSDCNAGTDTARLAHVVFPSTTWGEKTGTVSNSERCISLQKGFLAPPGEARHDWQIISEFGRRLGHVRAFSYRHPAQIFREHARLSGYQNQGRRVFDLSALADISDRDYEQLHPIQWPVNADTPNGRPRLFEDGRFATADGRARLVPVVARLPLRSPAAGQMIMNTGRIRDQWHTMGRTGTAARLFAHRAEPFVDLHPDDLSRLGLAEGELVELGNRGARYLGLARRAPGQRPGEVFVPMHWNRRFASFGRANDLVNPITDPLCGQPEFKHSPVSVRPYATAWRGQLWLAGLGTPIPSADYWARSRIDRAEHYRLADTRVPKNWSAWLAALVPDISDWVEFTDSAGQYYRAAGFLSGRLRVVLFVRAGLAAQPDYSWLASQLDATVESSARYQLLAGRGADEAPEPGPIVCSCFQVGTVAIRQAIERGATTVEALAAQLKCGTHCGSCVPELNALIAACAGTATTSESC
jgi:assimilatory nitrate reductase catalytic subunit